MLLCFILIAALFAQVPCFGSVNIDSLKIEAAAGKSDAQIQLATVYRLGLGVSVQPKECYRWSLEASNSGRALALFNMACCFNDGLGLRAIEKSKARSLFKAARSALKVEANAANGVAAYAVWTLYTNSLGVNPNEDSANFYLSLATREGFAPALLQSARRKLTVAVSERDSMEAMAMLRSSADQLYVAAMVELSSILSLRASTEKDAFLYARKAASIGSADAAYLCGAYYYAGIGVVRDTVKSEEWFLRSANAGLPKACAELGYRYSTGIGVPKSSFQARQYLHLALALARDEREEFSAFVHHVLDTLARDAKDERDLLQTVVAATRTAIDSSARASMQGLEALCSNSRKIWRILRDTFLVHEPKYSKEINSFACVRSGSVRMQEAGLVGALHVQEGKWVLTENSKKLKFEFDSTMLEFTVVLLSPGYLVLQNTDGHILVFEQVTSAATRRVSAYNSSANIFGDVKAIVRKIDISDNAKIRVKLYLKNVPLDGVNVSLDSVHFSSMSLTSSEKKESFSFDGEELLFEDAEYTLLFDVHSQHPPSWRETRCSLSVLFGYTLDDRYQQICVRTKEVSLPQRQKP